MKPSFCAYLLGAGSWAMDPARGARVLVPMIRKTGVSLTKVYDYGQWQTVTNEITHAKDDVIIILVADSCGANRIPWIIATAHPHKVHQARLIQPSYWCGRGQAITDNVEDVKVWYSDWLRTAGLGVYKPPLQRPPPVHPDENLYDGKVRIGNNGKTKVSYTYHAHGHPDDDDPIIQNEICADIKQLIGD